MRMARKLATVGVRNFGKNDPTQLEPALGLAIEFSGLKRIAHFAATAKNNTTLDARIDLSFQAVVSGRSRIGCLPKRRVRLFFRAAKPIRQSYPYQHQRPARDLINAQGFTEQ